MKKMHRVQMISIYFKTIILLLPMLGIGWQTDAAVSIKQGYCPVVFPIISKGGNSIAWQQQRVVPGLAGNYKAVSADEGNTACDLRVQIRRAKGAYTYTFYISGKIHTGKVKLQKGEKAGELYITFLGIPWAEYEGNEDVDDGPGLKKPVGISGIWSAGEINIQNTGNSMNYYVQIAECDQKFINLIKQK